MPSRTVRRTVLASTALAPQQPRLPVVELETSDLAGGGALTGLTPTVLTAVTATLVAENTHRERCAAARGRAS